MIVHPLATVKASDPGFLGHGEKVAVIYVAEDAGEIAARPKFVAGVVDAADLFEGGRGAGAAELSTGGGAGNR